MLFLGKWRPFIQSQVLGKVVSTQAAYQKTMTQEEAPHGLNLRASKLGTTVSHKISSSPNGRSNYTLVFLF
jgi:hypothetical protein